MGRSSRQAASDVSWDKMAEKAERDLEIRTRRRDRKGKAGTKTSNGVGDEGKEERERGRERKNEIRFYSSRKYKLPMYIFGSLGYTYCSTKQ